MVLVPLGSTQTEIQVNGTTEYGPSEQSSDTIYELTVSTNSFDSNVSFNKSYDFKDSNSVNAGDPNNMGINIPGSWAVSGSVTAVIDYDNTNSNFTRDYEATVYFGGESIKTHSDDNLEYGGNFDVNTTVSNMTDFNGLRLENDSFDDAFEGSVDGSYTVTFAPDVTVDGISTQ